MYRYQRILTGGIVLLFILGLISILPIHGEQEIYDSVIRLHVLANSDTEDDQALKLMVRDEVLRVTEPILQGCTSREQAEQILGAHADEITAAAQAVVTEQGYDYPVTVLLGKEEYPTRNYENCCFPSGSYVSLRVCIGEAEGQNWWYKGGYTVLHHFNSCLSHLLNMYTALHTGLYQIRCQFCNIRCLISNTLHVSYHFKRS